MTTEHAIDLETGPEEAVLAIGRAAEAWGAELEMGGAAGGVLRLPVVAGLRRGLLSGQLAVEATADGSRVVFRPQESSYYLHTASVGVLVVAGLGSVLAVAWPLYPELLGLAPLGAVLALSGWFLVVSRLRSEGPEEFLKTVAAAGGREWRLKGDF
jgi:hypothetical protein